MFDIIRVSNDSWVENLEEKSLCGIQADDETTPSFHVNEDIGGEKTSRKKITRTAGWTVFQRKREENQLEAGLLLFDITGIPSLVSKKH